MSLISAQQEEHRDGRATVVLDVGKTLSKLTLFAPGGRAIEQRKRANQRVDGGSYPSLDVAGIEAFLEEGLRTFARLADIGHIIPVGHGAAAAIIEGDHLAAPPLDYEHPIPAAIRETYDAQRDPFLETGSPALPLGLNLGAQLHFLETLEPTLFSKDSRIVPWAQYWSWLVSGVAASEVTSLGCHTDLWRPLARRPSDLAVYRGWAERLAPLQPAAAVLGPLRTTWAERTGLSSSVQIHCGLHDSNAALLAARWFPELASCESTVLSTGTWFVALRTPAHQAPLAMASLDERRDCLMNVDVASNPVPSVRFMGGREIELLLGSNGGGLDAPADQPALLARVAEVLASGAMALPTLVPGCGPFPNARARWISTPDDDFARRAAISLYAALVADAALDLIGSRERLLIEGRFSACEVFVRALASLRPDMKVYVTDGPSGDASFGALQLVHPGLRPPCSLIAVEPLEADLTAYRTRWRYEAERSSSI
jgi:sugar (pentulose or hexulose) kinase